MAKYSNDSPTPKTLHDQRLNLYNPCMKMHFNTAGPQQIERHYTIDPLVRIDQALIEDLVDQQRYFVLHAPRQTGKTTCMLALRDFFNAGGHYCALYVNIEAAQAMRGNVYAAVQGMLSRIAEEARATLNAPELKLAQSELMAQGESNALAAGLRVLCESLSKPLILFLDEVDALVGDTLISLLRQIRAGYTDRPKHFPQSIVLCGVRDVRDYRMTMADGEVITGGSAFNIKAKSLRLGDFSRADMAALYQLHTDATGQRFSPEALNLAWESTEGQPWLVNALAEECCYEQPEGRDRSKPIEFALMRKAREALILRNDTHLDQLTDKLREPRVRAVIEPMLLGELPNLNELDLNYVRDLGLIRLDAQKNPKPANQIYAEVLPRVLTSVTQFGMHSDRILPNWQNAAGKLDPAQLMRNFMDFWRSHGEPMMKTVAYHEAAPTLVLMAYLQRVINGQGRIEREYAAGSGRMDLFVEHGDVAMVIEIKVWRDKRPDPIIEGLEQIERYLARLELAQTGLNQGFLVLFDQRASAPEWEARMRTEHAQTQSGKAITVLRG